MIPDMLALFQGQVMVTGGIARILLAGAYMMLAWLLSLWLPPIGGRIILTAVENRRSRALTEKRTKTVRRLGEDLTRALIFGVALFLSLALFVNSTGLLTFLGLFSAAFGLGARPLVSDYISGLVFLVEDQYSIGDKVEIIGIEGTVEDIRLRITMLRAQSGELHIIPNGEIRAVRNFARGTFSLASIQLTVQANDFEKALSVLEEAMLDYHLHVPQLIERPQIVTASPVMGNQVEIMVIAKAAHGNGAQGRQRLLQYVHNVLAKEGIVLVS